jgi:hypothetical protein
MKDPNLIFDREFQIQILPDIISAKEKTLAHLYGLKQKFIDSKCYNQLNKESRELFLMKIWELRHEQESESLKCEIKKLSYTLFKAQHPLLTPSKLEIGVEHAKEVSIGSVVRSLLNVQNLKYNINCPFHKEKTGSLRIYEKTNTFYCFGCHEKGDTIAFVMKYQNLDFKGAIEFLEFY